LNFWIEYNLFEFTTELRINTMLGVNNITLQNEEKEKLRIERKRAEMERRRQRILNPRIRTIGLDTDTLDKQVAEKRQSNNDDRRADELEALKNTEIERVLAAAVQEEKDMRSYQMSEMRKSWDEAVELRRLRDEIQSKDIDFDRVGMAAAVNFAGEDINRGERLSQQKAQVRTWVSEAISEKDFRRSIEKEENDNYLDILRRIDETREESERDEAQYKRNIRMKFAAENTAVMMAKKEEIRKSREEDLSVTPSNLPIVVEDKNLAMDSSGRIVRKDMFKGFTADQQRTILASNAAELQAKRDRFAAEKEEDRRWALQTSISVRAMEQANQDEDDIRAIRKQNQLNDLKMQIAQQTNRRNEWESARFGSVGEAFFGGFGTSGR